MANPAHQETSADKITQLVEKDKGGDFTELRKTLMDDYLNHPQLFNSDLSAASKALQDNNILPPGTFLTGIDGEDFVIKSADGKVAHRSSTDMGKEKEVGDMATTMVGGRAAKLGPDGSGTVTDFSPDASKPDGKPVKLDASGKPIDDVPYDRYKEAATLGANELQKIFLENKDDKLNPNIDIMIEKAANSEIRNALRLLKDLSGISGRGKEEDYLAYIRAYRFFGLNAFPN